MTRLHPRQASSIAAVFQDIGKLTVIFCDRRQMSGRLTGACNFGHSLMAQLGRRDGLRPRKREHPEEAGLLRLTMRAESARRQLLVMKAGALGVQAALRTRATCLAASRAQGARQAAWAEARSGTGPIPGRAREAATSVAQEVQEAEQAEAADCLASVRLRPALVRTWEGVPTAVPAAIRKRCRSRSSKGAGKTDSPSTVPLLGTRGAYL